MQWTTPSSSFSFFRCCIVSIYSRSSVYINICCGERLLFHLSSDAFVHVIWNWMITTFFFFFFFFPLWVQYFTLWEEGEWILGTWFEPPTLFSFHESQIKLIKVVMLGLYSFRASKHDVYCLFTSRHKTTSLSSLSLSPSLSLSLSLNTQTNTHTHIYIHFIWLALHRFIEIFLLWHFLISPYLILLLYLHYILGYWWTSNMHAPRSSIQLKLVTHSAKCSILFDPSSARDMII